MSYFISVLIYFCIATAMGALFKDQWMENGWITQDDLDKSELEGPRRNLIKAIAVCAIPILRGIVFVALVLMAFVKKEYVNKW